MTCLKCVKCAKILKIYPGGLNSIEKEKIVNVRLTFNMLHLRYSLICAILCSLLLLPAEACECDLEVLEIEHAAKFADVIFIGIVYNINDIEEKGQKIITLRILKSWKKPLPDIINVTTSAHDLDCGFSFHLFETYLVYASGYYDKELTTGICTRTHPIYDDDEDMKYIHKIFKGY